MKVGRPDAQTAAVGVGLELVVSILGRCDVRKGYGCWFSKVQ